MVRDIHRLMSKIGVLLWLFCLSLTSSFAQKGKIHLKEVEVTERSLPILEIKGREYSFRESDYFLRMILKSRFWQKSFYMKIDLASFYVDSTAVFEMEGKTKVFIDQKEMLKKHPYRRKKSIQRLSKKVYKISISKEETEGVIAILTH